jgi:NADPH-dependent 2,4-dienoyl-CoA reductase/sulfur reductase-like enzyme
LVGAQLRLGTRIVALDPASKMVVDAAGNAFGYDRLLLAPADQENGQAFRAGLSERQS